ncbi:MAG: hypothetical protein RBR29_03965 [Castellaniella sp.]|uniref:hypothetical protein n=1 Tax=Castellaniella sp. TaxID=1955812 RepID=UPI002A36E027|nr:hypothetical protein [Castellaniella sp.]MDY0308935.1 hypothetical protein [Castellaniella sp.]
MAGFLLAAIPVLTLGLGGVEAAYWASLRQTLSLALMEAARVGATHQARPQTIARAFEHGLRMVYPDSRASARALRQRQAALGTPWHIHIAQPTPETFLDHADPDLRGPRHYPGQPLIRNDYQAQQHARRLAQGWPDGRGPRSGLTLYEANTLVLELWWPHRPLLPGMTAIVRTLAPLATDPTQARLMAAGYLPFRRHAAIAMQSHPAAWPDLEDGRVTHGKATGTGWTAIPPGQHDPHRPPDGFDPDKGSSADGPSAPIPPPNSGTTDAPAPPDPAGSGHARDETITEPDSGTQDLACEPTP